MKKKHVVTLTEEERGSLQELISSGKGSARKLAHARILLKADDGAGGPSWTDGNIGEGAEVATATVERVRKRFVEEGLEAALVPRNSSRHCRREARRRGGGSSDHVDLQRIACRACAVNLASGGGLDGSPRLCG